MKDGCLICGKPLEYLVSEQEMTCMICGKIERSKARCTDGHYVCDACHIAGLDSIIGVCLAETSKAPAEILGRLMDLPFCHMHGPEHHVFVGASLLTAYRNAGGEIDLAAALREMCARGAKVPGGACGFWGACGAGISSGMFVSILTGATPLATTSWGLSNRMTAAALEAIGTVGGPRCCKRDSYLSINAAIDFVHEQFGVTMERTPIQCRYSYRNEQCKKTACPFYPKNTEDDDE